MAVIVGQRATGRDLRFLQPLYARLAGDITTSSNDVLTDVPGLAFLVEPDSRYHLDGYIIYSSATAADFQLSLSGPANASPSSWGMFGLATGTSATSGDIDVQRSASVTPGSNFNAIGGAGVGTLLMCMPHGVLRTRDLGGALQLQFRQNVSTASATTIKAGSWLRLTRTPT